MQATTHLAIQATFNTVTANSPPKVAGNCAVFHSTGASNMLQDCNLVAVLQHVACIPIKNEIRLKTPPLKQIIVIIKYKYLKYLKRQCITHVGLTDL